MASHIIYYYLMLFIGTYILTSIGIRYFKINNESLSVIPSFGGVSGGRGGFLLFQDADDIAGLCYGPA